MRFSVKKQDSENKPARRHSRSRRYFGLFVLTCLVVISVAYFKRMEIQARIASLISEQLSHFLDANVVISTFSLDLFDRNIRIQGVRLASHDPQSPRPLLELEELSVAFLTTPTTESVHLAAVSLTKPVIYVAVRDNKLAYFPGIQKLLEPSSEPKEEAPQSSTFRLDIDHIQVTQAAITIEDLSQIRSASIESLDITGALENNLPNFVEVRLANLTVQTEQLSETLVELQATASLEQHRAHLESLTARHADATLAAHGELDLPLGDQEEFQAELEVNAGVNLDLISRLVKDAPELHGQASLEGTVRLSPGLEVSGNLAFSDVQVEQFAIESGSGMVVVTEDLLTVSGLQLLRHGGHAGELLVNGSLGLQSTLPLDVEAQLEDLALSDLFEDLGLSDPWVMAGISGRVGIKGQIQNPMDLKGKAALTLHDFRLYEGSFHNATPDDLVLAISEGSLDSNVSITSRGVKLTDTTLATPWSKLFIDGLIGFNETLQLEFDAVNLDLAEISPLAGLQLGGKGWGKGRVAGPFSELLISMNATLFESSFEGYRLGDLEAHFIAPLDSSTFFKRLPLQASQMNAIDYAGLQHLSAILPVLDQRYLGRTLQKSSPPMLLLPDLHTRIGDTRVDGVGAIVFDGDIPLYFDLTLPPAGEGALPTGTVADLLAIPQVVIEQDPINSRISGHLTVMGPPLKLDGRGTLSLARGTVYGQHIDSIQAEVRMAGGVLVLDEVNASAGLGTLSVAGLIDLEGNVELSLQLRDIALTQIDALKAVNLEGTTNGIASIHGSFGDPTINGQLSLRKTRFNNVELGDTILTLATADETLHVDGIVLGSVGTLDATLTLRDEAEYAVNLTVDNLALDPYFSDASEGPSATRIRLSGGLQASGKVTSELLPTVKVSLSSVLLEQGALELQNEGPVEVALEQDWFRLKRARLIGPQLDLALDGTVSPKQLVDLNVQGTVDMGIIGILVPDTFQRIEGRVTLGAKGEPFRIGGTLSALEFEGEATIEEGAFRSIFFPPTIDQLMARVLVANKNEITIERLNAALGGGSLTGSGNMILGPDYYPRFYDLRLDGKDAFVHYPEDLPPGLMDASLRFNGEVGNLLMSGDLWLQRMVYRERYNWEKVLTDFRTYRLETVEASIDEDPLFRLNVGIHAPGTFFLRNNLGNVQMKGELQLTGDTNIIELYGEMESLRGTIRLFDNTFDLTRGKFEFTGNYWNPILDLRMETQVQSYTLFYDITGTLENYKIDAGSDAGLDDRDVNSLIAFGTLADNITEGDARALAAPTIEFLVGRFGSGFLQPIESLTGIENFAVIPSPDEAGNLEIRLYGEKEFIPNKLLATGFYDFGLSGNQEYQADLEWRALDCCSAIFRLQSDSLESISPINPGLRLKLEWEFE